jgi:hypothetical protein
MWMLKKRTLRVISARCGWEMRTHFASVIYFDFFYKTRQKLKCSNIIYYMRHHAGFEQSKEGHYQLVFIMQFFFTWSTGREKQRSANREIILFRQIHIYDEIELGIKIGIFLSHHYTTNSFIRARHSYLFFCTILYI